MTSGGGVHGQDGASPPTELLRIISIVLGESPETAFTILIDASSPFSVLRQRLCHRLGGIPDFSLTLFRLTPHSTPVSSDTRLQYAATACALEKHVGAPLPPQFGEIGKWIDPGKVPEMFGADLVKDPFECIGKVLGHARVSEEWKKMRRPVREEDWETVDGGLDTLHVVVVLEKDPGLPPSYEDLKDKPTLTISDDKKQLLQTPDIANLAIKKLLEDFAAGASLGTSSSRVAPPRINSRNAVVPPHILGTSPSTMSRERSAPIPPSRDVSLTPRRYAPPHAHSSASSTFLSPPISPPMTRSFDIHKSS